MEDANADIFGLLVHYLYTQQIELEEDNYGVDGAVKTEEDNNDYVQMPLKKVLTLADLWTLAYVCKMKSLQNEVMAMMWPAVREMDGVALRDLIDKVYQSNFGGTTLKRMVIERIVFGFGEQDLTKWMEGDSDADIERADDRLMDLPEGVLVDLVIALKSSVGDDVVRGLEDYLV